MNAEQNKNRVIEAWKVFKTRDMQQVAALFADDAEWIAPPGNATAVALEGPSHMVGKEAIAEFLCHGMYRLFADVRVEFRSILASGDTVVVEERMSATLPGGRAYQNDYCFLFVLDQGRIKQVREYMDTRKGQQQIFG